MVAREASARKGFWDFGRELGKELSLPSDSLVPRIPPGKTEIIIQAPHSEAERYEDLTRAAGNPFMLSILYFGNPERYKTRLFKPKELLTGGWLSRVHVMPGKEQLYLSNGHDREEYYWLTTPTPWRNDLVIKAYALQPDEYRNLEEAIVKTLFTKGRTWRPLQSIPITHYPLSYIPESLVYDNNAFYERVEQGVQE